jgi:hypothetical protein
MARYAPLPSVSIDPRNEAEIVQQAAQRVYQTSNQTLNDFSSGNPLAALLEGQAFAQGEFLFWANQLPQSILIEWLGPFLGAMRRLGTPAVARLLLTVPPADVVTTVPIGTAFTSNANLTGGEAYTFITDQEVIIPAGESQVFATVASQYVGSIYNVAAGTITGVSAINVNGLTATNPQPAVGGSDVETYQEVQERFFTLIRRPNPVSAEDWQNFFIDFYGIGTITSVQPNRPNQGTYNYLTDYLQPNGQASFFVLGPDGVELTQTQLERGQNVVNYSVPIENRGHLYPITLSQVQYNISLAIDANGAFGVDLKDTSLNFRDRLFQVLQPGNVFPPTVDPTVSDVDAAFYSTFDSSTRFVDPHIEVTAAYNTPPLLEPAAATYTQVYTFQPSQELLNKNDLVEVTKPVPLFYPVLNSFTPYSIAKKDQTIYNNLALQQIQYLVPGDYLQGQVAYWDLAPSVGGDGELHVINENLTIGSQSDVAVLITQGKISGPKTYSAWPVIGNAYQETTVGGVYDPEIILYDYTLPIVDNVDATGQFVPPGPVTDVSKRPGAFIWVVSSNFTLQPATNDITGAQTAFKLGSTVQPQQLQTGVTYAAGTWVYTPQIGSGPNPVADPYFNYVDVRLGVVNKYAYVVSTFTFEPQDRTINVYFDELVTQSFINEIVVQSADGGLPIYKYKPRFPAGTYLEYRHDFEETICVPVDNECIPVRAPHSDYYIAASYFTPNSANVQDLVKEGLVFPLYINTVQGTSFDAALAAGLVNTPTRMFRFFAGDRTFFRQGSKVISYTATTNVHPLFEFYIYLANGIFVETAQYLPGSFEAQQYIPYFDPAYVEYSEDTILAEDNRNLYRVMKAFSPNLTVTNWTNTTVTNTARIEEYEGNLLRYVDQYTCEESILSQLGRDISAIKLGIAQVTLIPKNKGRFNNSQENIVYVWENAATLAETPQLSWFSGTTYPYQPPDYKTGTMKL